MAAFKEARKQLAKIGNVEDALTPDGKIDMRVLAKLKANGVPLEGNLALLADFAKVYPDAAKNVKGMPAPLTLYDGILAAGATAAGHLGLAATEVGGRILGPKLAARGMLQTKTPDYKLSGARKGLSDAFTMGAALTPAEAEQARQRRSVFSMDEVVQ
jgi:hypothetical protein